MKKYDEPMIDVLVIGVDDTVNNGDDNEFGYQSTIGKINGGKADWSDDEPVNDHSYNNSGF